MKTSSLTLTLVAVVLLLAGPARAELPAPPAINALTAEEGTEEPESVEDMFLRCCWARGRAAYNFCHAYAACAGVGEAVCRGVGAADGMRASCANPPARLEELEGG